MILKNQKLPVKLPTFQQYTHTLGGSKMTQPKQKPVSVYIKKIASGNYQLFTATGLALPVHHSDHHSRIEAQQAARSLHASVVMEVR